MRDSRGLRCVAILTFVVYERAKTGQGLSAKDSLTILSAFTQAPPAEAVPEVHDVGKVPTMKVSASMYDYGRLQESNVVCRMLLGVASDELRFVRDLLRLAGSSDSERQAVNVLTVMSRNFSMRDQAELSGQNRETFRLSAHGGLEMVCTLIADPTRNVEGAVKWLSEDELRKRVAARKHLFEEWARDRAWIFVDGTSLVLNEARTATVSREFFVTYKGHHAVRYTALVAADSTVLYITPVRPGVIDDARVWRDSKLASKIDAAYTPVADAVQVSTQPFPQRVAVGADKGYGTLDSGERFRLVVTATGEKEAKKGGKKKGDVTFSAKIAKARSVVERVFAHLKRRHGILNDYDTPVSNVDCAFLDRVVLLGCTLLNRKIAQNELKL